MIARPALRFAYRLALALGRADVEEMLRGMSAREFVRWWAFYAVEPWGFREENRRVALLGTTIANVSGKTLKKPLRMKDFMPDEPLSQTALSVKAKALLGGLRGNAR